MRDEYFNELISSCNAELKRKGITIDVNNSEDIMLLSDFSAWRYRKRNEDAPLPNNIRYRIINRQMRERAGNAG